MTKFKCIRISVCEDGCETPTDEALLRNPISDVTNISAMYDEASNRFASIMRIHDIPMNDNGKFDCSVHLYVSGFTVDVITSMQVILDNINGRLVLMYYNWDTDDYYPQLWN